MLVLWKDKQNWQTLSQTNQTEEEEKQNDEFGNEKGDITTKANEIERIIKEFIENVYSNKLENLEEMN
jgi:hypothetical protein